VPDVPSHVDGPGAKMYAPNIWPERPPEFKKIMLAYYRAMSDLAWQVLSAMTTALGMDAAYFSDKFDRQASVVRVIRYPAVTRPPLPGQLRAGTHTDYGSMTFVRGDDTAGGLQVKHRQGGWVDVHIPSDGFCCNIGDLMARWSNDRWVSTLHRVAVPPPDAVPTDRISLVFFQNPNPDAVIRCFENCVRPGETAKYPPITVAEHYLGKLMKAGHSRLDAKAEDALSDAKPRAAQIAS
jgi:isopenicillin N synthase-like dioxygenase